MGPAPLSQLAEGGGALSIMQTLMLCLMMLMLPAHLLTWAAGKQVLTLLMQQCLLCQKDFAQVFLPSAHAHGTCGKQCFSHDVLQDDALKLTADQISCGIGLHSNRLLPIAFLLVFNACTLVPAIVGLKRVSCLFLAVSLRHQLVSYNICRSQRASDNQACIKHAEQRSRPGPPPL